MNLYELVKRNVTSREAAEHYGLSVNRSGMCKCPFHPDRNPSMKVDWRYHCFGCGADGDVIDFVSKLFGIPLKDSAEKLARDFGLKTEQDFKPRQGKNKRKQKHENNSKKDFPNARKLDNRKTEDRQSKNQSTDDPKINDLKTDDQETELSRLLQNGWQRCWDSLCEYRHLLVDWKERYAPQPEDTDWHPLFQEACHKFNYIEYLLDRLWEADIEETAEFILSHGKEVAEIEQRVNDYRSHERTETEDDAGYAPASYETGTDQRRA